MECGIVFEIWCVNLIVLFHRVLRAQYSEMNHSENIFKNIKEGKIQIILYWTRGIARAHKSFFELLVPLCHACVWASQLVTDVSPINYSLCLRSDTGTLQPWALQKFSAETVKLLPTNFKLLNPTCTLTSLKMQIYWVDYIKKESNMF